MAKIALVITRDYSIGITRDYSTVETRDYSTVINFCRLLLKFHIGILRGRRKERPGVCSCVTQ